MYQVYFQKHKFNIICKISQCTTYCKGQ